jgi:Putative Flp pilus-assembly TadE/G-like
MTHPRRRHGESGQTMIMVAILLPVILGVSGLALDVGSLYSHKRRMQTAADAAALAGAHEVNRGRPGASVGMARREAKANGFENAVAGATITVHYPPISGNHIGNMRFVEVVVDHAAPTWFMSLFGWDSVDVKSRAVAGAGANGKACVYVLDPDMGGALQMQSSAKLDATCGIIVNSSDAEAVSMASSSSVIATQVSITGGYQLSGATITPTPVTGIPPAPDPLAYLTPPSTVGCDVTGFNQNGGSITISPGVYCKGMKLVNNAHVFLSPGMYVIKGGGIDMQSGSILEGTDVTFFITEGTGFPYGTISMQSGTVMKLKAPTTGPYAGILFYQDPEAGTPEKSHHFESDASGHLEGALYFPTQQVKLHSTAALDAEYTLVVARTLSMQSGSDVQIKSDYSALAGGSPIKRISLVE